MLWHHANLWGAPHSPKEIASFLLPGISAGMLSDNSLGMRGSGEDDKRKIPRSEGTCPGPKVVHVRMGSHTAP